MPVRGTRISLDIILCADIPIDRDALQNTLTSAIRIFDAKLAARGDVLMDPDPWFAPEVEGRNCGMAVRSGKEQATLKYQAVSDALIGLFRFYHSTQLYKSSMSIVNDKNQAETQWDVGTIVIGPLQAP